MKLPSSVAFLVLAACLAACDKFDELVTPPEEVPPNPYDTSHPSFVPPSTTITEGPASGTTINTSSVTFNWIGSKDVAAYQYQFDSASWSSWASDTSVQLSYLDEGVHTFFVRSRHKNGVTTEENPPSRSFTVDAVKGPSLMFVPRLKNVSAGQSFIYDVKAEEVTGLFGSKITITYDRNVLRIDSIQAGSFTRSSGGTPTSFPPTIDNTNGKAMIELVILGGNPKGVGGTGVLASLFCRAVTAGSVDLPFLTSETACRDTANAPMSIREFVPGKVVAR